MARQPPIDMGNYIYSAKEQLAYLWCVRNNIYISPKALSSIEWFICIVINGKENISPESYKKTDIWKQIYKFYTYYYDKYNKELKEEKITVVKKEPLLRQQTTNSADNLKLF
jgi:hypothetical protein